MGKALTKKVKTGIHWLLWCPALTKSKKKEFLLEYPHLEEDFTKGKISTVQQFVEWSELRKKEYIKQTVDKCINDICKSNPESEYFLKKIIDVIPKWNGSYLYLLCPSASEEDICFIEDNYNDLLYDLLRQKGFNGKIFYIQEYKGVNGGTIVEAKIAVYDIFKPIPFVFIRSALFSVVRSEDREELISVSIQTSPNQIIIFTGEELNQYDLDVLLAIIDTITEQGVYYNTCETTITDMLRKLDKKPYCDDCRTSLIRSLERMKKMDIKVYYEDINKREILSDSLIQNYKIVAPSIKNRNFELEITLNHEIRSLFKGNKYSYINSRVRKQLGRKQLAKWVYDFFCSHHSTIEEPCKYPIEEIRRLCGSKVKNIYKFTQLLEKALKEIKEACRENNEEFIFEIKNGILKVVLIRKKHLAIEYAKQGLSR